MEIDLVDRDARIAGRSVALAADEYRALKLLAAHDGAPVRTRALCRQVEAARADETVLRLSRKLARAGPGELIGTLHGVGYAPRGGCKVSRRRPAAMKRAA